ncbi:MAG: NAD(P)/FAD-dependent oxidoreductase [Candidatus Omnitrophica bacterium]|nr:NAD(P)/FAD-dependent oxidoreductase [Candidatus Omnitrophota bacterium]
MGYKELSVNLGTDYTEQELCNFISKKLSIKDFLYKINKKSLDARNRSNIHWQITVEVSSKELKGKPIEPEYPFDIPYKKRNEKVVVVGSGPAGFFSAFVLQKAGFNVTLLERGADVSKREKGIRSFEKTGTFDPISNYAFGEGGAGTFSDGKLTSRSKHISKERQFIISQYIEAGAPEEIAYLTHAHIGSNNLKRIVKTLRARFINSGGKILFESFVKDIKIKDKKAVAVTTLTEEIDANIVIMATGLASYETYKMLIKKGVGFNIKNFALGCRVEHEQQIINLAQWGKKGITGVKAAEYRLAAKLDKDNSVYTFCMCPGGTIIPSTAYEKANIVNGMSMYERNSDFANAGCVTGINLNKLIGKELLALEALDWLKELEQSFYKYSNGYAIPACTIKDFMSKKISGEKIISSYPLGVISAPLWELLPAEVVKAISLGLVDFSKKIRGFDKGNIMGLETKTSSVIQVIRQENALCHGFENLYMIGEGSGYSGGIISSGADGVRAAMWIIAGG